MTHVDELDESYMSQVMTVNGKIGWIGGNGRPDLAAGHSIIAGDYRTKSPQLVALCNRCVKQANEHKIELTVWPIPLAELRFVGFCDSSFDFKGERHQQGWINGFTNKYLNDNRRAPVSIAAWKSRKLSRKAGSPQLVETYAASGCCAELHWLRCMFYSSAFSDYDIVTQRPKHIAAPGSEPAVLRTDREEIIDPEVSILSDSKGLYDALNNELPQDDKKSAVEMPIIEAMLTRMKGRSRWIPHNFNPATIFLGDCGSLLLGYVCVVIILMLGEAGQTHLVLAGLIVFSIPIIDTLLAIVRRRIQGKSFWDPDAKHLHHILKRRLGGVKSAVLSLYGFGAFLAVLGAGLGILHLLGHLRVLLIYLVFIVIMLLTVALGWKMGRDEQKAESQ